MPPLAPRDRARGPPGFDIGGGDPDSADARMQPLVRSGIAGLGTEKPDVQRQVSGRRGEAAISPTMAGDGPGMRGYVTARDHATLPG